MIMPTAPLRTSQETKCYYCIIICGTELMLSQSAVDHTGPSSIEWSSPLTYYKSALVSLGSAPAEKFQTMWDTHILSAEQLNISSLWVSKVCIFQPSTASQ